MTLFLTACPSSSRSQAVELLSSWLHCLVYANDVAPLAFARVLGRNSVMWSQALDRMPADIAKLLSATTSIAHDEPAAMMSPHALPCQLLFRLRNGGHRTASTSLQFCSIFSADMATGNPVFTFEAWLSIAQTVSVLPQLLCGL
ncbi:hypothetical protein [Agrobacterium sp. NPDC090283]|uniref:hypothetical protein n=1 Tax=Agrobacterium sp. NPDC090283 TaxID=3363920 RepID=UPI00383B2A45